MVRNTLVAAATAVMLVWLAGCACSGCQGQPVPEDKLDYVGNWNGDGISLIIASSGSVSYKKVRGGKVEVNAPIQEFTDEYFTVGIGPATTKFTIDSPPAKADGKWSMTIDGNELTRPE